MKKSLLSLFAWSFLLTFMLSMSAQGFYGAGSSYLRTAVTVYVEEGVDEIEENISEDGNPGNSTSRKPSLNLQIIADGITLRKSILQKMQSGFKNLGEFASEEIGDFVQGYSDDLSELEDLYQDLLEEGEDLNLEENPFEDIDFEEIDTTEKDFWAAVSALDVGAKMKRRIQKEMKAAEKVKEKFEEEAMEKNEKKERKMLKKEPEKKLKMNDKNNDVENIRSPLKNRDNDKNIKSKMPEKRMKKPEKNQQEKPERQRSAPKKSSVKKDSKKVQKDQNNISL